MDLAKQAAIAAAQSLGEYDQIGIVAFEDQPRWVIPPTSATDLSAVEQAIGTMQPGGGTEIYPALKWPTTACCRSTPRSSTSSCSPTARRRAATTTSLTQQMNDAESPSARSASASDADTNLLQQLAQLGNGRYYDGNDPFNLPQLVVKDAQQVQRAAIVEQDFQLQSVSTSPALHGIDTSQSAAAARLCRHDAQAAEQRRTCCRRSSTRS